MKKSVFALFIAVFVSSSDILAQEKVIENPVFEYGSTDFHTQKVIVNDSKTTIGIAYKTNVWGSGWTLDKNSHLESNGKSYTLKSGTIFHRNHDTERSVIESEPLDYEKFYKGYEGWDSLSLDFEPLDKDCKSFDFIETTSSDFNHYGVRLDGKDYDFLFKDKVKPLYKKNDTLSPITPQYGKSIVNFNIPRRNGGNHTMGVFLIKNNFTSEYFPFDKDNLNQAVTESGNTYFVRGNGSAIPSEPFGRNQFLLMMVPGTETTVTFDAATCLKFVKSGGKAKIPFDKCVRFSGSISDLQEVLMREREFIFINKSKYGIGPDTLWKNLQENIKKINGKEYKDRNYTRRQKEFLQLWMEFNYVKEFQIKNINPNGGLKDVHASELMLLKDGRSFYLIGNDDYLDYAHANGIKGEVTEWMEGYRRAMNMANRMSNLEILPEEAYDTIPLCFRKELHQLADSTLATIEKMKKMQNEIVIKETPDVDPSEFLKTVIDEYKGCVVFFDFWATWCGPCRMGIEAMEAKKSEFAGKPVKFIYVTNGTSPFNEWTKKAYSMPGIHYRLTDNMWDNIKEIGDAIPRYLMFDKEGKQIYEQTGYDEEVLEAILTKLRENL